MRYRHCMGINRSSGSTPSVHEVKTKAAMLPRLAALFAGVGCLGLALLAYQRKTVGNAKQVPILHSVNPLVRSPEADKKLRELIREGEGIDLEDKAKCRAFLRGAEVFLGQAGDYNATMWVRGQAESKKDDQLAFAVKETTGILKSHLANP